jgi:SAM-dependent methyltransferase
MQSEIFEAIYQNEKTNWWFVARRRLVRQALVRHGAPRTASGFSPRLRLLDIGCGTGAMLEEFAPLGTVVGTDLSPVALQFCLGRGLRRILFADGTLLPFADGSFDGISAMDVIEHIEDDAAVLRECQRICAPGGVVLITVPALRWLWSTRDERLAHKRRYHRAGLMAIAQQVGFEVEKCSYYTLCLLPPFAAVVWSDRLLGRKPHVKQDVATLPRWANRILLALLLAEQWLMRWVNYPAGVSLFCVLRKPVARS